MDALLPAIEIETALPPQFSVIWLHGLGADGSDFVPLVPELGIAREHAIRFIFPHAPSIPVSCNGGYVMPAWYDIVTLDHGSRSVDEAGIAASRQAIARLIARENERGIPCRRIFLAGFSQGGAIAYNTALTYPERLAGVIALSTYHPLAADDSPANRALPIFAAHGRNDDVVPLALGLAAKDRLLALGHPVEWHAYPIDHTVCVDEIEAIGHWLGERLAEREK